MFKKISVVFLAIIFILGAGVYVGSAETVERETLVGYSQAEPGDGYVEARVILEKGDIIDVDLTEYNDLGQAKDEGYPLDEFHEAIRELPGRFVEADSADIDTYSGATGTSNSAIEAVSQALDKADGVTEFDGSYMGVSEASERGAYGVAWVTVEAGQITDIYLEEVSDGDFKDEDYGYDEFHEAREEMPARFVEADSYNVDTYTGATGSSDRWIQAVTRALAKSAK